MNRYRYPLTKLTLKLDIFAYSFPAMLQCINSLVSGSFNVPVFLLGFVSAVVVTEIPWIIMRNIWLNDIFEGLNRNESDPDVLLRYKIRLLSYPRNEAMSVIIRWPLGIVTVCLTYIVFEPMHFHQVMISTGAMSLLPLMTSFFLFRSEILISDYLKDERIAAIAVREDQYKKVTIFFKILFITVSVLLVPMYIYLNLFIHLKMNMLPPDNLELNIVILSVFMLINTCVISYIAAKDIKLTMNNISSVTKDISNGQLASRSIPLITTDEAGTVAINVNTVANKLTSVLEQVFDSSGKISDFSNIMTATSENLASSATEQAASLEEIATAIEEISGNIADNAGDTLETSKTAKETVEIVDRGWQAVTGTIVSLNKIAEKIKIIDDIAFQTNLLALNAAIEAAHAGKYGKGFAVVAMEIRKLAEKSQSAAKQIGDDSRESADVSGRAVHILEEIVDRIRKTSELMDNIATSSEQQSAGISEIKTSVDYLNSVIQTNASASEELASTSEELQQLLGNLKNILTFFSLNTKQVIVR